MYSTSNLSKLSTEITQRYQLVNYSASNIYVDNSRNNKQFGATNLHNTLLEIYTI